MTKAKIYYHDIGDYLSREEKLSIVKKFGSIVNVPMQELTPNEHGDWISMRNDAFDTFIPMAPEKKFDLKTQTFFNTYSNGVVSSRDAWVYNFSKNYLKENMSRMIAFYNKERKRTNDISEIENDDSEISWSVNLKNDLKKNVHLQFIKENIRPCVYRPFVKSQVYFDRKFIERPGFNDKFFPAELKNLAIGITGIGASKEFSVIITNSPFDFQTLMNGLIFPIYHYEEKEKGFGDLFENGEQTLKPKFERRDGISDFILERATKQYGKNVSKEDIFYYVYGFLHSPEYRETFANDLKKMLPRLPLVDDVKDFWAFSNAGRKLAELHLNYESVAPYSGVIVSPFGGGSKGEDKSFFRVEKMRYPKKGQKDTIIYNSKITISNIPEEAYEYVVNGKSAIEWIMERYAVTTHKDSGITNDPNDWADEVGNPRYILDLLLSVINVSVQTVGIVKGLPKVKFD